MGADSNHLSQLSSCIEQFRAVSTDIVLHGYYNLSLLSLRIYCRCSPFDLDQLAVQSLYFVLSRCRCPEGRWLFLPEPLARQADDLLGLNNSMASWRNGSTSGSELESKDHSGTDYIIALIGIVPYVEG